MKSSARKLVLWVPALLLSLAGCGLKGPLYLPDEQAQAVPANEAGKPVLDGKKVRTVPPAPQAQKKDRERATQPPAEPAQSQPTPVSPPDPDRPATTPLGP